MNRYFAVLRLIGEVAPSALVLALVLAAYKAAARVQEKELDELLSLRKS